jgi:hypothetical protein
MKRPELQAAQIAAERAEAEAAVMSMWSELEAKNGRPEAELTWDNCVRELGLLHPGVNPRLEAIARELLARGEEDLRVGQSLIDLAKRMEAAT